MRRACAWSPTSSSSSASRPAPGYFKVQGDTAVVLVDSAVPIGSIDIVAAERARDEAQAAVERFTGDEEQAGRLRSAQRDLEVAENLLKVAGRG